ncbi:hypothetical protein QJS10_CPB19g00772 [Acorus calamus]|uniref:Ubiquitin-like-conjugating enzyme ATG10 n=1 Tax=Acorus calamus TaxID=4465 RepID=A0AAV9CHK2_ACOCL|nr:hypothetical protein QJS10_CPB19g00772 [Acorus calamus]
MAWDGTLTPDEFEAAARTLCERWSSLAVSDLPLWTFINTSSSPSKAEFYLSLEDVYRFKNSDGVANNNMKGEGACSADEEDDDKYATALAVTCNQDARIYDFHVVYSFSYRVPVLYFRGRRIDGQPLELQDIEKDLPQYALRTLRESKWTFITWEDHPYLHRPWYMLHPCGTSQWMKLLYNGEASPVKDAVIQQYLACWLSVVGQAVGLRIPLELHNKFL